jgi:ATP-dependent helicase HepA
MAAAGDHATGTIVPGQRWMSDAEPELGLGMVVSVDERCVDIVFPGADETRRYALQTAPLRRVRFAVGDVITDRDGQRVKIDAVEERDRLLTYRAGERALVETQVSDRVALTGPRERLLAARVDAPSHFDLRLETLRRLHALRKSKLRGFVGPRVELLPHQFFIASEVTGRRRPRVLLADETGLGKTIEAGLILNRLLLTGRAARVLVLVPESLVHQWLVELRRRFNLPFAVFDEQRCEAVESGAEITLVETVDGSERTQPIEPQEPAELAEDGRASRRARSLVTPPTRAPRAARGAPV